MIPRFKPAIGMRELSALARVQRPETVAAFERAFADKFGAREAIAFPYGRSALWAFLQAVGVEGAEVVMPAYTCSVVAHAITLSGNHARFVDIQLSDYNMDLDLLPQAITARTRAIVATHLFGYPLDLDRLEAIVADAEGRYGHKIWLIQDCAHSFGATWNGRNVGASGDVALYGLNISKTMTSIFGGMLTFRDDDLAARVRAWRDARFRPPSLSKAVLRRAYMVAATIAFQAPVYGFTWWLQERTPFLKRLTDSYHLDDIIAFPPDHLDHMLAVEAAVGLVQLSRYDGIIEERRRVAAWYDANLPRRDGWALPPIVSGATYSHYVVRVPDRKATVAEFAKRGVHLGELIQYSIPSLSGYDGACANALAASKATVNFPLHTVVHGKVR